MAKPGEQREEFAYKRGRRDERQRVLAELRGDAMREAVHGAVDVDYHDPPLLRDKVLDVVASVLGSEEGVMPKMFDGPAGSDNIAHNAPPSPSGDGREDLTDEEIAERLLGAWGLAPVLAECDDEVIETWVNVAREARRIFAASSPVGEAGERTCDNCARSTDDWTMDLDGCYLCAACLASLSKPAGSEVDGAES